MAYHPLHRHPDQTAILRGLLERAEHLPPGHVAVLDLDGCLMDNRPRQVHIIREFASTRGIPQLYQVESEHIENWNLQDTLACAGLAQQHVDALLPDLRSWWNQRFYKGEYQLMDQAMPGAANFVRSMHDRGICIVYLTGRMEGTRSCTSASLERFGFPLEGQNTRLLMRTDPRQPEQEFKRILCCNMGHMGRPFMFMDNIPGNLRAFSRIFPRASLVFLDTDHSHEEHRLPETALRIRGFLF